MLPKSSDTKQLPTPHPTPRPTLAKPYGSKCRHIRHQKSNTRSHVRAHATNLFLHENIKISVGYVGCVGNIYNCMNYK